MSKSIPVLLVLALTAIVLAACGRADPFAPTPTSVLEPTTRPPAGNGASLEEILLQESIARGEVLFNAFQPEAAYACSNCHSAQTADRLVGPGLLGLGEQAATRVADLTAAEYLLQSIVNPDVHIVEADPPYPDNQMPEVYGQIFTQEQLQDLVNYLSTL
jgi:hypothetical protein